MHQAEHEPLDDRLQIADVVGLAGADLARGELDDRADDRERVVRGGEARHAAARRDAILEAFADSLYRDNLRAAPTYGAPTFASRDDAFAIIGACVELVSRSLRTGQPPDVLALEPVIARLMLGALERA